MDFECTIETLDGISTIRLSGEADVAGVDQMHSAGRLTFGNPTVRTVEVDCSRLAFCDSTTLGAFVAWRNMSDEFGCALRFRHVPAQMAKVLRLTALDEVFDVVD